MSSDVNGKARRKAYIFLSLLCLVYFISWKATLDTYTFWLSEKIGLDGVAIGIVYGVNGCCAVLIKPVYGLLIDRLGLKKHLLFFITIISMSIFPFFYFIYQPLLKHFLYLGIVCGGVFLSLGYYAGVAALESYLDRFGRLFELEFGQLRMWGAVASVVSAGATGYIFNINPMYNFGISTVGALLILVVVSLLKLDVSSDMKERIVAKEKTTVKDVRHLFVQREFWSFVVYVCGIVWILFVAEQQYPRFFLHFTKTPEEGHTLFGYLTAAAFISEFIFMMIAPAIVNRIGPKYGLLITGVVVAGRFIGSGLATSILAIGLIKLSWGIEMAFLLVSVFKYLEMNFDKKVNALMYLFGYQTVNYIGTTLLSPLAGYLYERIGFAHTYLVMGSYVLVFTLISALFLKNNKMPPPQVALIPKNSMS